MVAGIFVVKKTIDKQKVMESNALPRRSIILMTNVLLS